MITWFRQLGFASRNLGRVARQNPVWAVQRLIFAPFRFARHLVGVVFLMLAVATVLVLGSDGLMWYFGLLRYPTLAEHSPAARPLRPARGYFPTPACCKCSASTNSRALSWVCDLLGQETVVFETMSRALDAEGSGLTFGQQHVGRPLLTPDEVRTHSPDRQLLFLAGQRSVIANKLRYYADREFAGQLDRV